VRLLPSVSVRADYGVDVVDPPAKTPPALLTSLIPDAFGPSDLNVTAALMSPQSHGMTLSTGAGDPVVAGGAEGGEHLVRAYTSTTLAWP